MKKLTMVMACAVFVSVSAAAAAPAGTPPFGTIDYIEGEASVVRKGKALGEPNIGDDIMPDDMIRTEADSIVIIALDRSTGMRGTLTIKPKTAAYIRLNPATGGPRSSIDLISGQIGSKLAKIAGSPSLQVNTDAVVMGVRGTAFTVTSSLRGSVLVVCTDGAVACTDGTDTIEVPAGKAAEKIEGKRFGSVPVAISSAAEFEKRWITDEIDAFKADAPRALADYAKRYYDLLGRFSKAFDPVQRSPILSKWIREDSAGIVPPPNDPSVMKEKKELMADILETRKVLFMFERIYYRILELESIVSGTTTEKVVIAKGMTAGDFIRKVRSDAPGLDRRVFLFRYAEKLYEQRNAGGAGFPGMDSGDDFFNSSDDWDF